jgi:hypothetical protein
MTLAAAKAVECVSGCDGGGDSTAAIALGALGLVVALVSAILAYRAMKASDESATAAQRSLEISEQQHEEFMREKRARADFEVSLNLVGHPSGLVETDAGRIGLTWALQVTNVGDKPATYVAVNFEAPDSITDLRWASGENDSLMTQKAGPHQRPDRPISTADGRYSYPSQFLSKIVDRINLRRSPRFSHVKGYVAVPRMVGEEIVLPVEMAVWSDDMGTEVPMRVARMDVTIRKSR